MMWHHVNMRAPVVRHQAQAADIVGTRAGTVRDVDEDWRSSWELHVARCDRESGAAAQDTGGHCADPWLRWSRRVGHIYHILWEDLESARCQVVQGPLATRSLEVAIWADGHPKQLRNLLIPSQSTGRSR